MTRLSIDRKRGFNLPLSQYFRSKPFTELMEDRLLPGMKQRGLVSEPAVRELWRRSLSAPALTELFWIPVALELWAQQFVDGADTLRQRLIEIVDQIGRVFEADRNPDHSLRHARLHQLLVGQPVLRRQDRQAADALDAAEAGGALDRPSSLSNARKAPSLPPLTSIVTTPPKPLICFAAIA